MNYKPEYADKLHKISDTDDALNFTVLASSAVLAITMGLLMAHRLRYPFYGLYTDYGLAIWLLLLFKIIINLAGATLYCLFVYDKAFISYF